MRKAKNLLKYLFRLYKSTRSMPLVFYYRARGYRPWSPGYFEYKWYYIKKHIEDHNILNIFKSSQELPGKFGVSLDERVVEYPWFFANLPDEKGRLLDAGSALNFDVILRHPKLANKKITIVTLAPESNSFTKLGAEYLYRDIRHLPFKDNQFDYISCISTLEHIGMDNASLYIKDNAFRESNSEDYLVALKELKRVLKPGGSMYITVPYGKYQHLGFFQQFDEGMIRTALRIFEVYEINYFRYDLISGWQVADSNDCTNLEYLGYDKVTHTGGPGAQGVACIKIIK